MAESFSGVSLDEEAARIIQYQQSFQAASQIIQVTSEMMDVLVSMI